MHMAPNVEALGTQSCLSLFDFLLDGCQWVRHHQAGIKRRVQYLSQLKTTAI